MVVFLTFTFYRVKNSLGVGHPYSFLQGFFQGLLIIFIVAMSGICIYGLHRLINIDPMAIISPNGIWIKQFGTIPWNNVLAVKPYLGTTPLSSESIGIQARDITLLSKQATITGKLMILQSKISNCPTIIIDNIELKAETVVNFANQF
jgi:hypothetical protein